MSGRDCAVMDLHHTVFVAESMVITYIATVYSSYIRMCGMMLLSVCIGHLC